MNSKLRIQTRVPNPQTLYHCSHFLEKEALRPGFEYTHKLVEWDNGESNHFLYATTSKVDAVFLGIASAIEHKWELDEFHTKNNQIIIVSPNQELDLDALYQLDVYLYTIPFSPIIWVKNANPDNNIHTEWKTDKHVIGFMSEKVDLEKFLKDQEIIINP